LPSSGSQQCPLLPCLCRCRLATISQLVLNLPLADCDSKSKLCYDRRPVGQSVLVSSTHLGPETGFLLLSDICGVVNVGRPLWREDRSVVYYYCCPRQRSHFQVRVPRNSWPHFTVPDSRLPQPGGPCLRIYPRNRVAQLYLQALGSLFVASYDSQGYSGGIRPCLQTEFSCSHTNHSTPLTVTSRHLPHRKHRSSVTAQLPSKAAVARSV
jgi:hypothetical protein